MDFSTNSTRRKSREAQMRSHLARLIRGVILRDGYSSRRYLPALATAVLSPPTSLSPIRSSLGLPAPAPQKPNRSGFAELHFRPRGSDLVRASSLPTGAAASTASLLLPGLRHAVPRWLRPPGLCGLVPSPWHPVPLSSTVPPVTAALLHPKQNLCVRDGKSV